MDPVTAGAILTGLAGVITAVGGIVTAAFRYVTNRDRYREAREEILFRRIALLRDSAPPTDPVVLANLAALDREWEALITRGKV